MQDSLANFVKPVARPVDDGQGTGEQRSWEEKQVIVKQRIIELQALWNFTTTCPPEFRVKKVTIAKMLAHLNDLPAEDDQEVEEVAELLAVTGAAAETAASGKSTTLVEGSQVRLLSWKQQTIQAAYGVEHRKVLCYPGCVGTVLSIDASEGAKGTFVEVAIKPEWFSARTVEVFVNEVELVGAVVGEPVVVEKPALIKVPTKRKHYSLGEMQASL